jgi:hypothetical protein
LNGLFFYLAKSRYVMSDGEFHPACETARLAAECLP